MHTCDREGRCCECDRVTSHTDGEDYLCPDCHADAFGLDAQDAILDDPRHGLAGELNRRGQ